MKKVVKKFTKKIHLLLILSPILIGISDFLHMGFAGRIYYDRVLFVLAIILALFALVLNTILLILRLKRNFKTGIVAQILLEIYSITYILVILFTYIDPAVLGIKYRA